jgi:FkbM family methyltransferase
MPEYQLGSFITTLAILFEKGVRYATSIDLGCADGNLNLALKFQYGFLPGATCVNVDANSLYEPSLREIQRVAGAHYVIAGISDRDGEIELRSGGHPYWASMLPPDHKYWAGAANPPGQTIKVRAMTLDTLVQEFALKPPFLLKLDLQGGELAALRGGEKMLAETDTVICESANDEFPAVCEFLTSRNLGLFDLTEINRIADGTLWEYYPVFLNRRLDHIKIKDPYSDPARISSLVAAMEQRRRSILETNARILTELRSRLSQ